MSYRFQALGPLQAGEGSRAFLGLAISPDNRARPVVIVWVPPAAEKDPALLEKIRRETDHAARLDHPNIVNVMGFSKVEEGHARIVEFADGESLRKLIATGKRLPVRIAARIICDAATGVHYAHLAGNDDGSPLVHGDLKPEMVLVSFTGQTKVTGYGALAFAPRDTGAKAKGGRRVHSAPEQIIGGREAMNVTTDVYLLGLMLYECLTGVVPWAEQGDFFDHAVLSLPLPPATPGLIPEKLEALIAQACAKKTADRFPTPAAFKEALEKLLGHEIASSEEVGRYLDSLFPHSHEVRADRRRVIDAGIADFVRREWAHKEGNLKLPASAPTAPQVALQPPPPPPVTPPTAPIAGRPAPTAAPTSSPSGVTGRPAQPASSPSGISGRPAPTSSPSGVSARPATPAPAQPAIAGRPASSLPAGRNVPPERLVEPEEDDDRVDPSEPQRDEGSAAPWLILLAFFVMAIMGWWAWNKANAPIPGVETVTRPVVTTEDAGHTTVDARPTPPPATGLDAGATGSPADGPDASLPDAGAASAQPDAGRATMAPAAADAGPVEVSASIESTPPMELTIDGKVVGRTPWTGRLMTGRRTLLLKGTDTGLSAQRVITVAQDNQSFKFTFEKGFVAVTAPEGAVILIDDRRVGAAPLAADLQVYEGFHRITVLVGQSKWNDTFTIYPGQRVKFDVELQ